MLQILSSDKQQSIKTAKLLAIFEGAKDSYENIQKVFGSVNQKISFMMNSVEELRIKVPAPIQLPKSPAVNLPTSVRESIPMHKSKHRQAARRRRRKGKGLYGLKRKVLLINQFDEANTATSPIAPVAISQLLTLLLI